MVNGLDQTPYAMGPRAGAAHHNADSVLRRFAQADDTIVSVLWSYEVSVVRARKQG